MTAGSASAGGSVCALLPDIDGVLCVGSTPIPHAADTLARLRRQGVTEHEVITGKPAPAIFQTALDDLRCTASQALMIGDDLESDVLGAQGFRPLVAELLACPAAQERAQARSCVLRQPPAPGSRG